MALKETNATTAEQMHEVAKYCIIDALSCQRLMVKHNAINKYREVASIAFLSLFDAHYFAGGMKVCNLLSASAWQRGILTSMILSQQTETGKFPGAYIFPPVKGLKNRRLVTGLDFASLYPSLIMTYNLSPDKIILSQEHAVSVEQSDKKLHKLEFLFNNQCAWSVQHNNIPEEKGLYVIVLEYLSAKRNELKRRLASLKAKKKDIDLVISSMGKDAEQYALKVYMNTFYGTAGDSKSPFFLRELAGGVTSAGRRNIKHVADFVKSKGFQIKYGDTDSLYLVCLEEFFQECDTAYDNGNGFSKEEY
ncbi:DNA polymerase family B-domain-containing protein [Rhizophagus diaphanus]|nr:DNA polymerase family B-domain-containing protein [Rhizophagus diaphanus] [Rhizophagus sp. MUCL 43196]